MNCKTYMCLCLHPSNSQINAEIPALFAGKTPESTESGKTTALLIFGAS
jgi:hypothetical protein